MKRKAVAEKSGVALANIIRFEQKGLISLKEVDDNCGNLLRYTL